MNIAYTGFGEINGPLVAVDNVTNVGYGEIAKIIEENGNERFGKVIELDGKRAIVQVFEGTFALNPQTSVTAFTGSPMKLGMSPEMLGRIFSGSGRPIDGLGDISVDVSRDVNGEPINPVRRAYPQSICLQRL